MNDQAKSEKSDVSNFNEKSKCITNAEFSAYLKSVGASQECQSCGRTELVSVQDWHWDKFRNKEGSVDLDQFEKYTVLRLYKVEAPYANEEWNMTSVNLMDYEFRIVCKHCGHVTSYLAWLVCDWLKNNEVA